MFSKGRWHVWAPEHPAAGQNGYVANARLEVEAYLGSCLPAGSVVHHIDLDQANDDVSNLAVLAGPREHGAAHASLELCAAELVRLGLIAWTGAGYELSSVLTESATYQEMRSLVERGYRPAARADWVAS